MAADETMKDRSLEPHEARLERCFLRRYPSVILPTRRMFIETSLSSWYCWLPSPRLRHIVCYIKLAITSMIHTDCCTVARFQLKIPVVREWSQSVSRRLFHFFRDPSRRSQRSSVRMCALWLCARYIPLTSSISRPFVAEGWFVVKERKVAERRKVSSSRHRVHVDNL